MNDIPANTLPAIWPSTNLSKLIAGLNEAFNAHGDIVRLRLVKPQTFIFRHPDHLKEIYTHEKIGTRKNPNILPRVIPIMNKGSFIHAGGEDWMRRRKMSQSGLTRQSSFGISDQVPAIVAEWMQRWEAYADGKSVVDIDLLFGQLAVNLTFRLLFSKKFSYDELKAVTEDSVSLQHTFADRDPMWLPTKKNRHYNAASARIIRVMDNVILERRESKETHHDILSMLMTNVDSKTGRMWTHEEIRDEMFSLYFGAIVIRVALTWMFYCLTKHPDARRQLEKEIDASLGGRAPTAEELQTLRWPMMIFEESTRIFPPVWAFPRHAPEPVTIAGYRFPADSVLIPMCYLAQRHPDFWENPEGFDPERFAPETRAKMHPYAYFPFGAGPRMCLGRNLSPIVCQHVLISLAQRYHLDFVPMYPDEPVLNFSFELCPKTPMHMVFKRR